MTREEYFRAVARKVMEIKALADNYEEGNDRLDIWITNYGISISNNLSRREETENPYTVLVPVGADIEDGEINEWMNDTFTFSEGEF